MLHQSFPAQDFSVKGGAEWGRQNLPKIRAAMATLGLDGFYLPHEDEYQNEYLPECNERLAFATGFTGSAGAALLFRDHAVLFVDGRYTLQGAVQTDSALFARIPMEDDGIVQYLRTKVMAGQRIGYDPWLMSPDAGARFGSAVVAAGAQWIAASPNPVDLAWGGDRPAEPNSPATPHPLELAGESSQAKCLRLGRILRAQGADAAILSSPISTAWLFNMRGQDVARTPISLSRAILYADGSADLFIRSAKVTEALKTALMAGNSKARAVRLLEPEAFEGALADLHGKKVSLDPALAAMGYFDAAQANQIQIVRQADPCALPRACKNKVEIAGSKAAHIRDGAILTEFLYWLDREAPKGRLDEIEIARKLESMRRRSNLIKDLSFDTISGFGANGALPHYRVNQISNLAVRPGTLYLVDSGGQYPDGTTDVTRTVAIGEPSAEMRERFTLVLKGHIALAMIRFPKGTSGHALDVLARMALWNKGLDYDHGTGHGVGSFLSVHEGPHRIAKFGSPVPLEPGMIVSNEPGYYKEGEYGIRIENLQFVTPAKPIKGGERDMLGFETLTLAPMDRRLVERKWLSPVERRWWNQYHRRVQKVLAPLLPENVAEWLALQCEPI